MGVGECGLIEIGRWVSDIEVIQALRRRADEEQHADAITKS